MKLQEKNRLLTLTGLPTGAIFLICSTIPPSFYHPIAHRLSESGRSDVLLVDCPISGGTKRAAEGTLTICASGSPEDFKRSDQLLKSMSETLLTIEGGIGTASKIKMVNQLLVGIHIAVARPKPWASPQRPASTPERSTMSSSLLPETLGHSRTMCLICLMGTGLLCPL